MSGALGSLFRIVVMRYSLLEIYLAFGLMCVLVNPVDAQDGTTSAAKSVAGDPSEWIASAKRILEIGSEEQDTAEQKAKANKELVALKPSLESDPRAVFAYTLVAMAGKKWDFAQGFSNELLNRHKNYVPARVAKARMLLILDKKLLALNELEVLAKGLGSPASGVTPEQLKYAAGFLGLAVGYLEGPGKDAAVKATSLRDLISTTDRIPQAFQESFSTAREAIGEEYRMLVENGEEKLEKLREDERQVSERKQAELDAQKEKTKEETEAAKKTLEANFGQAKSTWDTAWAKCKTLSQNANVLQMQRNQLVASQSLLRPPVPDANGNVDPVAQNLYQNNKRQSDTAITNLDFQLNQLASQYDLANRNGMIAENQMNAIRLQAEKLGMTFAMQTESFAKAEKMIRGKEKKEQSSKKAEPKMSSAELRKAKAFATYDDFNFYKEQTLLLDSFPTPAP
jgi:hypothetical protein